MPGNSNIVSNKMSSMIERNPRAPVLRSMARLAIATRASSVNVSLASSSSNKRWYCLTSAFLGLDKIVTSASSSRSSSVAITGKRPTNSGIKPNFSRSSGSRSPKISPTPRSSGPRTSAPKPIPAPLPRCAMILSRPANAPPQTNKMFVVSTCKNSCWGCFRPPCGGTEAIVPSIILSSACCTPSPDTSRVMEGLSDLRVILSTSSMYTMPRCARSTLYSDACKSLRIMFSTSSPT